MPRGALREAEHEWGDIAHSDKRREVKDAGLAEYGLDPSGRQRHREKEGREDQRRRRCSGLVVGIGMSTTAIPRSRQTRSDRHRCRKESLNRSRLSYRQKRVCTMPWYQAVLLLGSAALSLIILIRPTSDGRSMAFTLLIGGLVLLTIGLALKEVTSGVSVAAWLGQ
jgi:hypothetical protein